jgi:hypothetical protein
MDAMKLPNGDRAIVDERKLRDYCLSPTHPYGKHKAKLFKRILGITHNHSDILHAALLKAAADLDATATRDNGFGQLYEMTFEMTGPTETAPVLCVWITLRGEDFPRLVTCYPI